MIPSPPAVPPVVAAAAASAAAASAPAPAPPEAAGAAPADSTLLSRFARDGDERAFAALVRRHAGLVYHTALRRAGDAGLAEEVTQSAFALLARKAASLTDHPHPAAWLYRAALWLAGDAQAREAAHRRRLKRYLEASAASQAQAHPQPQALASAAGDRDTDSGGAFAGVLPHLDAALQSLRESDRRLILMRFHENLSFQAMGERLHQPHDTARKATARAVERLGTLLRRRTGVMLSAGFLSASLSGVLTQSAPAALLSGLPAASLAAAPSLGGKTILLNSLHTMTAAKQTAAAAALVVLLALPAAGIRQWRNSGPHGGTPAGLEKVSSTGHPGSGGAVFPAAAPDASASRGAAASADVLTLLREVEAAADPFAAAALAAFEIRRMDPALIPAGLETVRAMKDGPVRLALNLALYRHWLKSDPASAATAVVREPENGYTPVVASVMRTWMSQDPGAATAWLREAGDSAQSRIFLEASESLSGVKPEILAEMLSSWQPDADTLAVLNFPLRNPGLAWEICKILPAGKTRSSLLELMSYSLKDRPEELLTWSGRHLEGEEKEKRITGTFQYWAASDPAAAFHWYQAQPEGTLPGETLAGFAKLPEAAYAAFRRQVPETERAEWDFQRAAALKGPAAAATLAALPEGKRRLDLHHDTAEKWAADDGAAASEWVDSLPQGADRDQAAAGLAEGIADSDSQAGLLWAASIGDPALRGRSAGSAWKSWLRRDSAAAWRWLRTASLPPDVRSVIDALNASPLR